jgi:CheY-like chemotaxis protein
VIEVLSEPEIGSTFNIYLLKADSQEARKQAPVVSDSPGGSETILVAEDAEDVLFLLSKMLEIKGYRVLAAMDGEEAISVFKANEDRIDLVMLDMVMPKLRGREVFERIREGGSDVPVMFCTAYSLNSSDVEFTSGKGLPIIQKPIAPDVLFTTVRKLLDQTS